MCIDHRSFCHGSVRFKIQPYLHYYEIVKYLSILMGLLKICNSSEIDYFVIHTRYNRYPINVSLESRDARPHFHGEGPGAGMMEKTPRPLD